MSSFPKVSIIIPVYNVEKYIRQCLDSVVNQTLRDIEIICINDCTPDNSFKIVEEYASKDSRFVLLEQETNQGQGIARNRALDIATGEYIMFLDPDDWYELDACEKCYRYIQSNNCDFIEFNYNIYEEKNKHIKNANLYLSVWDEKTDFLKSPQYIFDQKSPALNKCYKMSFLKKYRIYFTANYLGEDLLFIIRCKCLANKVCYLNAKLSYYRISYNSSSTQSSCKTYQIFNIIIKIREFLISQGVYEKYMNSFNCFILDILIDLYYLTPSGWKGCFENTVAKILDEQSYAIFLKQVKIKYSFGEQLFSIKNTVDKKHKIICILGVKIKIRKKSNNHIFLVKNGIKKEVKRIKGIKFHFSGINAIVEIGADPLPKYKNVHIYCKDNTFVQIQSSRYYIRNTRLEMQANNSKLFIDKDFSCEQMCLWNSEESNTIVKIGKNCMFSAGINIRTSDSHSIYDNITKEIINKPQQISVEIGNHVWMGLNSTILKNTKISDNSIVGAGTIVNKKFEDENVIIAGVPAKIIKRNVNWSRYHTEQFEYIKDLQDVDNE